MIDSPKDWQQQHNYNDLMSFDQCDVLCYEGSVGETECSDRKWEISAAHGDGVGVGGCGYGGVGRRIAFCRQLVRYYENSKGEEVVIVVYGDSARFALNIWRRINNRRGWYFLSDEERLLYHNGDDYAD